MVAEFLALRIFNDTNSVSYNVGEVILRSTICNSELKNSIIYSFDNI